MLVKGATDIRRFEALIFAVSIIVLALDHVTDSFSWWRHEMETFSALLALCAGNSPVIGEFPAQKPVTQSFDTFFDLRLNKQLSKQSWGWLFEKPSRSSWRHCNVSISMFFLITSII